MKPCHILLVSGMLLAGCTTPSNQGPGSERMEWGGDAEAVRSAYEEAMDFLARGRQRDAETVVSRSMISNPDAQRLLFLRGVLELSRGEKTMAYGSLAGAYKLDHGSVPGRAANLLVPLDLGAGVEAGFSGLDRLIRDHPDELLLRWLFAMEALRFNRHGEDALEQCAYLLEQWRTAPATLHSTYAALLTNVEEDPDQALAHRYIAAELEPGPETYRGLAYTLALLERYADAALAYGKLIEMDGGRPGDWFRWGNCLAYEGDFAAAAEKFERACFMDSDEILGFLCWGRCLERLGDPEKGYSKYLLALENHPGNQQAAAYVAHAKLYGHGTACDFDGAVEISAFQGNPAIETIRNRVELANQSGNPLAPAHSDELLVHLTALGDSGDAEAQYGLGMIYRHGIGVEKNADRSERWLSQAAENGHIIASRMLNPPL